MLKMKLYSICLVIFLLAGCASYSPGIAPASASTQAYWPAKEWRTSTPEEMGMDSEILAGMFQQVETQQLNLHSLLIVRNGSLVTESYFHPYTKDQPQGIQSVTKSVISTLVGIAIQQGYIQNTDQKLVSFFPDQKIANLGEEKKAITLKDLLSLTAGLKCNDSPFSGEVGMEQSSNWVQFMLDVPMTEQPGTKFNYCGGAVHLLSAILQKTTGMTARDFANRFLFEPLGIAQVPESRWSMDPQGISTGPYGLYLTPRDLAKLGYLYLQNGKWNDQQIISADWVKAATANHTIKDNGLKYGYLWTIDPAQGSYSALGFAGQEIYVIPGKNLVVVFTAALPSTQPDMDFLPLKALVDTYIIPSVKSEQALAANSVAVAKLNNLIENAANPQKAAQSIPEGALQWSGLVYQLDPNPNQWETISFAFERGGDTLTATLNGETVDPLIGLDNRFRIQKQADVFAPQAIRGYWENDATLVVQQIYLGEIADNELRAVFSQDTIDINGKGVVNGQPIEMHGKRVQD